MGYEQVVGLCATASQIVRNFGEWQEKARHEPVYVMHRGNPRLVLTSVELMQRLCETPRDDSDLLREREYLLSAMREIVLLVDAEGNITASNAAARIAFGLSDENAPGMLLDQAIGGEMGQYLGAAARRVAASRMRERVEVILEQGRPRTLSVAIVTIPSGSAIVAEDISAAAERDLAHAAAQAIDGAIAAIGGIAAARINLRGYISTPTQSLADLTELSIATLRNVRFVGLFDIGSRATIGTAIEAAMAGKEGMAADAALLIGGTRTVPVRIGFAPYRRDLTISGVKAVVAIC